MFYYCSKENNIKPYTGDISSEIPFVFFDIKCSGEDCFVKELSSESVKSGKNKFKFKVVSQNGNTKEYNNKYYQPYLDNQIKCFLSKTEYLVIKSYNGDLLVTIDEKVYELKELERKKVSLEFDTENIIVVKEDKKYIPPMTHPWKIEYFKKQIRKVHTQHIYA